MVEMDLMMSNRHINNPLISIHTENTSLVFRVDEQNYLSHSYFGDRLEMPEELLKVIPQDERRFETFEALSVFGGKYIGEPALEVTHADGNMTTDLRFHDVESRQIDENVSETRIRLKDTAYAFSVTLIYRSYFQEDIITSRTVIENKETGSVILEQYASFDLVAKSPEFWLTRFGGDGFAESQAAEEKLGQGLRIIDSKKGVRATRGENPSFMISLGHPAEEEEGEVIGGALAWSGNFRLCFELDVRDQLHLTAGINPFGSAYHLNAGQVFETPEMIFTYSSAGKGPVTRRFHRWARRYVLRGGAQPQPIVLNSWEGAYFSFDEDTLTRMMTDAATLGVELFVLDDGWFGNKYPRNDETVGLGDWQVNADKLPRGLDYLIDHAEKEGLKFGIWLEPEMISPKSELAEAHPDWIIRRPNREPWLWRHQLILDLSNPAVQEFVFKAVDDLLIAHPRIAYVKWDCNRHIENFGSSYLPADRQSHLWVEYVRGLYAVYDRLTKAHPTVMIQACASGGGRVDFGALARHHEFWASDNTDPFTRIQIQWGIGHFYPAMAMAAHVSASPNHETLAMSPLKFRFDVAMAGRLGIELQPADMTAEDLEFSRHCIAEYKRVREVIQTGDLYRLISPHKEHRAASVIVSENQTHAIVFAYNIHFHVQQDFPVLKLRGLDLNKMYRVRELNRLPEESLVDGNGETFSGKFLIKHGLRLRIDKTAASVVCELTEEAI